MEHGVERLVHMWGMDSNMSPETLDLLTQLLKINQNERITVAGLMNPAFFQMEMELQKTKYSIVSSFQKECPAKESQIMNI